MPQIKFITKEVEYIKTAKGGYNKLNATYKDPNGKIVSRGIFDFAKPAVYKAFDQAAPNDVFDVEEVKNDRGYWEFVTVTKATSIQTTDGPEASPTTSAGASTSKAGGVAAPRSNFETPDERAERQRFIVRQSSIGHAIELAVLGGDKKASVDDIIKLAKKFESFVFGEQTKTESAVSASVKAIMEMKDPNFDEVI
jgi:hypothetical protein